MINYHLLSKFFSKLLFHLHGKGSRISLSLHLDIYFSTLQNCHQTQTTVISIVTKENPISYTQRIFNSNQTRAERNSKIAQKRKKNRIVCTAPVLLAHVHGKRNVPPKFSSSTRFFSKSFRSRLSPSLSLSFLAKISRGFGSKRCRVPLGARLYVKRPK